MLGGGTVSLAVSCGGRLLFALCSSVRGGGCCWLVRPRHCCGVKSCRCARLCFCFCFGLVNVMVVVRVAAWMVLMRVSFAVDGVGEGGMHGSAHRSLTDVHVLCVVSVVVVVVFVGGDGEGGTHGSAHNSFSGVCAVVPVRVVIISFVIVGVGCVAGAVAWAAAFASSTNSSQSTSRGRLSSGLPWLAI